jgi:predicted O-linked N-acetylglucosamine transferase (SPINDLY family)
MTLSEALQKVVQLLNGGQADAAFRLCAQIRDVAPGNVDAIHFSGIAAAQRGHRPEAIGFFRRALELQPDAAAIHNNLGNALREEKHYGEAEKCFERALELDPDFPDALNNLGIIYKTQNRPEEALDCFRRALTLFPDFADAHNNLGAVLTDMDRYEEASASLGRTLELQPDFPEVYLTLGKGFDKQKRHEEALACYQKALELRPGLDSAFVQLTAQRRHLCDWKAFQDDMTRIRSWTRSGREVPSPFYFLSVSDDPAEQLACARQWTAGRIEAVAPMHAAELDANATIRIAYLSADFREHPCSYLLAEVFEIHDRDDFEIHAFAFGPEARDPMRTRLEEAFDYFHDVAHDSDREIATKLRDLGIHIAVDLMGHTRDSRPGILAHRPAPVQVNYLGYAGTTGADFIDYVLVDQFIVPPGQQSCFTERLVHLPHCYMANDRTRAIAEPAPSRQECGLPDEGFVYCCFNNINKITPDFFDAWMRLLTAVPRSVLWLMGGNAAAESNLRREAQDRGVDPARLVFAPRIEMPRHLARHRNADLFLDTLPFNAHTTASDALWSGLPVLTCAGRSFAARVAGSLLQAAGLPELVTRSLEEYEALAVKLALNPGLLHDYRNRLEENKQTCPLFDTPRFTRNLESAYHEMVRRWRSGQMPEPFTVGDIDPDQR